MTCRLPASSPTVTVLGHRDPNLANYSWDGHQVRIVDFEDQRLLQLLDTA